MKKLIYIILILLFSQGLKAQIQLSDTTKKWYVPTHATAQYAGNFGLISLGAGYDWVADRLAFDLVVGYLPESVGGINIWSLNSKFVYKPWHLRGKSETFSFVPISIGIFTYHAFGEQYVKLRKSGNYPQGYYWWPNSTRFGVTFGQHLFYNFGAEHAIRAVELYWEMGAHDLGIYSWGENKVVKRSDILSLGVGFKAYF